MNELLPLIGKSIRSVEEVHDYVTVVFVDGSFLHIYNLLDRNSARPKAGDIIVSVSEHNQVIEVRTLAGSSMRIGLRETDYSGPEAFGFIDAATGRNVFYQ